MKRKTIIIKVVLLLFCCGCASYLIMCKSFTGRSYPTDDELRLMDDSLIAQYIPKPFKYIKYVGSYLCVVRDTVEKENWLYRIGEKEKESFMSLRNWHLDSIPGTYEYLFLQKNENRYFLDAQTLKKSTVICFSDFNIEYGLGKGKNGFFALGYSNAGRFRYLVCSDGTGCYLWGIDQVRACDEHLNFSLGIKPCSFSMNAALTEMDSIYVPYPADTKLIQQKYTVDREGKSYVRLCINLTYPIGTLEKHKWLKEWISYMINRHISPWVDDSRNYHGDDPITLCDRYSQYYADSYNEECPWSDRELWFHWEKQVLLSLQWKCASNRYLTFYVADDGYYGGVHGIYTREYVTVDLEKERALTFESLIKPSKRQYVKDILLQKMKADYCKNRTLMTDAEYLLYLNYEDEIKDRFGDVGSVEAVGYMRENFSLNDPAIMPEGLVFYYAPYEIDSFAAGNKFFVLTYQELKKCLAIEL